MPDDDREGLEFSRRIREELERIRESETRVEEALDAVRQARRRVEAIARELGREEQRVRALVREELSAAGIAGVGEHARTDLPPLESAGRAAAGEPSTPPSPEALSLRAWRSDAAAGWSTRRDEIARRPALDPSSGATPSPRDIPPPPAGSVVPVKPAVEEEPVWLEPAKLEPARSESAKRKKWSDRRMRVAGIVSASVLAVATIGWFAIRGFQKQSPSTTVVSTEAEPVAAPAAVVPEAAPEPAAPIDVLAASASRDPAARVMIYDSLWTARSNLFDTLLATVDSETSDRTVKRAIAAWKDGSADAQQSDLLHSAFVQHVLKQEVDPQIELDGQLLRNPCRGRSCTALLNAWQKEAAKYGLSAPPSDAPTNMSALRQAEVALVLAWMRELHTAPQTAAAATASAPSTQ